MQLVRDGAAIAPRAARARLPTSQRDGAMTVRSRWATFEAARRALGHFGGVARRFEHRGEVAGITFVDDYAHLPTEVRAALEAARFGNYRRVVCVFQPHRYTRTRSLWQSFADAFVDADLLVITDVYPRTNVPPGIPKLIFTAYSTNTRGLASRTFRSGAMSSAISSTNCDGALFLILAPAISRCWPTSCKVSGHQYRRILTTVVASRLKGSRAPVSVRAFARGVAVENDAR